MPTIDPRVLNILIDEISTKTQGKPVDYVALATITVAWGAAKDAGMSDVAARRELLQMIDFARDNSIEVAKLAREVKDAKVSNQS